MSQISYRIYHTKNPQSSKTDTLSIEAGLKPKQKLFFNDHLLRLVYIGEVFWRQTPEILCTCPGHLGHRHRQDHFYFSHLAKASMEGDIASLMFLHTNFAIYTSQYKRYHGKGIQSSCASFDKLSKTSNYNQSFLPIMKCYNIFLIKNVRQHYYFLQCIRFCQPFRR